MPTQTQPRISFEEIVASPLRRDWTRTAIELNHAAEWLELAARDLTRSTRQPIHDPSADHVPTGYAKDEAEDAVRRALRSLGLDLANWGGLEQFTQRQAEVVAERDREAEYWESVEAGETEDA